MSVSIKIKGLETVLKALAKSDKDTRGALGAALYQEGLSIMSKSVRQVPVDTGRLRATHYVAPPEDGPRGPAVELGYGTNYAQAVHERTYAEHKVGNAKYLERPLDEARSGYAERLGKRTQSNIRSGTTMPILGAPTSPQDPGPMERKDTRSQRKAPKVGTGKERKAR